VFVAEPMANTICVR